MRLSHDLDLEASPRAVQSARRWVASACDEIGRPELADSAELGLSELVTNALLHGRAPIRLVVAGTRKHPRIEVHDSSPLPPVLEPAAVEPGTSDEDLLSTVGRGLSIVATLSRTWGAEVDADGKVVWFEPAAEVDGPPTDPAIHYLTEAPAYPEASPETGVVVELVGFPPRVFADFRRQFRDVRRELRLLALSHADDVPLSGEVTAVFDRFDATYDATSGTDELEGAVRAGLARTDVRLVAPSGAAAVMAELGGILDLADEFAATGRLLSLVSTDQQRDFRGWLFGEFAGQEAGRPPQPWAGSDTVDVASVQS